MQIISASNRLDKLHAGHRGDDSLTIYPSSLDEKQTHGQRRVLPDAFLDAWFRLATTTLCMTGRIDTFDSHNLTRKIETFSQVSGKDGSISRKTPEFWRAVFGFASRRSAAAGPQARI